MVPGDTTLALPAASSIGFKEYLRINDGVEVAVNYEVLIKKICEEKFSNQFENLLANQRLEVIKVSKAKDGKLFVAFLSHLINAYYTNPIVLVRIGAGSVPPFPDGNQINDDDWTILEGVYERGCIYRDIN